MLKWAFLSLFLCQIYPTDYNLQVWGWGWLVRMPSQQGACNGEENVLCGTSPPLMPWNTCKWRPPLVWMWRDIPHFGENMQGWTRLPWVLEVFESQGIRIYWPFNDRMYGQSCFQSVSEPVLTPFRSIPIWNLITLSPRLTLISLYRFRYLCSGSACPVSSLYSLDLVVHFPCLPLRTLSCSYLGPALDPRRT